MLVDRLHKGRIDTMWGENPHLVKFYRARAAEEDMSITTLAVIICGQLMVVACVVCAMATCCNRSSIVSMSIRGVVGACVVVDIHGE